MGRFENGLEVHDGHLCFEDVDVVDLARQVETPFFLYSERRLRDNVFALVEAFAGRHAETEVFYASKACSNLWFLDRVRRCGINIEVNGGGELWKARKAGFTARQIVFNGVAKSRAEIGEAVAAGIRSLVVDSLFELRRVAEVAREYQRTATVDVRVDVEVPTLTHPGLMTSRGAKAGIDIDEAPAAFVAAAADEYLDVRGLHLHIGSQITSVDPYVTAVTRALDLIEAVETETGLRLERINAGGGIAIPYRDTPVCEPVDYFCSPLSPDAYAEAVCGVIERRRRDLTLFIEPGRAIAGNAALLVSRVENEKTKGVRNAKGRRVGSERWLMIDAGFNVLLEHTNYDWYYRTVVANRAAESCDTDFRLGGPLCDGGDVFAGDDETPFRRLPAATGVGDMIAFLDAGAYALEMMNPYNGRPRAGAYAVRDGDVVQIRAPESHEDLVALDVDPRPGLHMSHAETGGPL